MVDTAARRPPGVLNDCWNHIGVRGDRSCPELARHSRCRNCPVYAIGAAGLLDSAAPEDYISDRSRHFARPPAVEGVRTQSVMIFRIAAEWLALPASTVTEVAPILPVHSLPHRRGGAAFGLVNLRGELLVAVSLAHLLDLNRTAESGNVPRSVYGRLLALRHGATRAVCPVDEGHGIHRFDPRDLQPLPTTIANAAAVCSTSILPWQDRSVGLLDDRVLFQALRRSLG